MRALITRTIPILVLLVAAAVCAAGDLRFPPGDAGDGPAPGTQTVPVVAAGDDGFLVAWQDYRSSPFSAPPFTIPGRGVDVYARLLDADGVPAGPPIGIAVGYGDQLAPQVAWNGENWLVAWETPCDCWSYSSQVLAVRVSPAGAVLDPTPIVVHTNASEWFRLGSNGTDWLVLLDSLRGVRVSAAGEVLNPGGTQLATRTTTGRQTIVSAQGQYLLAWDNWNTAQGQRFAADLTPLGPAFSLPTVNVASSGDGYFLTWIINDTYWDDWVYGRRLEVDGTFGPLLTLAGVGGGLPLWNPAQASISWDGTNWWVAWGETTRGTVFSRVAPDDTVLDFGGLAVDPTTAPYRHYGAVVAGRPAGGAEFVWQDRNADGGFEDILSAAVDAAGVPAATEVVSGSSPAQLFVDYAAGATELMAVYRSEHSGERSILARRFDADGNALDAGPILIRSSYEAGAPAVGFDGTRYLVVWAEGTQVYGRRLLPGGSLIDAAPLPIMAGDSPDVAGLDGDFLVVSRRKTTAEHIFQPFSMRVDGATGATLDPDTMVIGGSYARIPRVIAHDGRWLAVFQRNFTHDNPNSDVRAAFVNADGSTTGSFLVGSGGEPDVAAAGDSALIVWRTGSPGFGNDIHGRFLSSAGALSAEQAISAGGEAESQPVVAWNGSEFVVAWSDRRHSVNYFDYRMQVYAARVAADGTVIDPQGFAFGDRAELEQDPAVVSLAGRTLIAASSFRNEPEHGIFRFAYEVLPSGNAWPIARAAALPVEGDLPLIVGFDSAGSTDPDGSIAGFAWDFGDGAADVSPAPLHTYTAPGHHLAQLEVTDDLGAITRNVVRVVVEQPNQLPVSLPEADVTSGDPPLAVVFHAGGSYDPDQGIQNWEWDFGDGWDYWGSTAYHTFTTEGIYTVTLLLHDFRGGIGSGTMTITVGDFNLSPVAVTSAALLGGPAPLAPGLDAGASWDPDGTIVSYDWDFGDGSTGTGAAPAHVYTAPGTHLATVTVTDDGGKTATQQIAIDVVAGQSTGWTSADVSTASGTVSAGSHLDTHDQDDVAEALTEAAVDAGAGQQTSRLEHVWTLDVTAAAYQVFRVDAHHTPNGEGDDFVFEYRKGLSPWQPMLTVTSTADSDTLQEYWFTEPIGGTLRVRVRDLDATAGNDQLDTLFVDEMVVESLPSLGTCGMVPDRPAGGEQPLTLTRTPGGSVALSWGASCVASDTDYAIYEGPLGAFTEHVPVQCSTGGLTQAVVPAAGASAYYLVVPHDAAFEGSYGEGVAGFGRVVGPTQCLPTAPQIACQ